MKLKNIILGLGLSLLMNTTFAQGGLEGIVVERYYQTDAADGTNASTNAAINALATGTVVYRVYVDMAAGYKFSQLYGASTHDLKLNTTTNFYNDPNYGSITNPAAISLINARKNTALIDSWFTAGGVCAGKSGVLKTEDIDGSIGNTQGVLANNPASCYGNPINGTNAQDGVVNSTSLTAVNPNILGITSAQLNLLDQGTGNSFLSNNGSIAALGGVRGTNASNMVLVGQFTTNGILSFELNVQIVSANGTAENWVARNRVGNEFTSPSLIFSSLPVAGTVSTAASTVCSGASSLLTLAGSDGTIQWQRSTTSATTGFSDIASANATTFNASNLTASAWYRAKVSKSSCAEVFTSAVLVTVNNPSAPSTTAQTFCSGTNLTVANLTATGTAIQWYSASTGGTALSNGTALASGNYFASQTVSGCEGTNRILTAITVNTTPSAPTAVSQDFCAASLPTVASLTATGTGIQWYSAATGGTPLVSTVALSTGDYFASQTVSGCESNARTSASIIVATNPVAGVVSAAATICSGNSKTLTLSGNDGTIQWQKSTTSATAGFTDIPLENASMYTATNVTVSAWYRAKVSKSTCLDVFTPAVKLTVNTVPANGGTVSSDITICRGTGTTLSLAGHTGTIIWQYSITWTAATPTWINVPGQTTASLPTGNLLASRAYRALLTNSGCTAYSNQVVVTVTPLASVSAIAGSGSKCINSTVVLSLTSFTGAIQWQEGTSATGTFTDIVGENSSTYTINNLTATRFFRVVVNSGGCSTITSAVATVTCAAQSVAGTVAHTGLSQICAGTSKTLTLTGSVGLRQWQSSLDGVNFTNITGATAAVYGAAPTVATYYRCRLTNSVCSSVFTNVVLLTISTPAVGGSIGGNVDACATTGTTLNLVGSNGTIAWQTSTNYTLATPTWTTVAGQTGTSFSTGSMTVSRAYRAVLTSGSCVSYSNQVIVTRNAALVTKAITSTTTSGTTALTALCTNDLTKVLNLGTGSAGNIQWQVSTDNGVTYTDIVGATTATYTIDAPVDGKNMFRVRLSNACGSVFSSNVFTVFYTTCGARTLEINTNASFGAIAYPNPFADNFMLEVSASTNEMIQVNVYDMLGKLVEYHQVNVSDLSTFVIGNRFVSGVYNIEVIQGTQIERLRVVKN